MDQIPASIPFHVARAYGLGQRPASQIEAKPTATTRPAFNIDAPVVQPSARPTTQPTKSSKVAKLVAASVPGSIRFDATNSVDTFTKANPTSKPASAAAPESFQLYRHPADKNAAATAVNAGRSIDLQG